MVDLENLFIIASLRKDVDRLEEALRVVAKLTPRPRKWIGMSDKEVARSALLYQRREPKVTIDE